MNRDFPIRCFARLLVGCVCLALLAALVVAPRPAVPPVAAQSPAPIETGFINGEVTANGKTMRYVVYVPRDYKPETQWPVIVFLHGGFADGNDGLHPLFYDLPRGADCCAGLTTAAGNLGVAVMRNSRRFPCLVVFPQAPAGVGYWYGASEDLALRALEEVVVKYNGDRNRVYLTGLSMGGNGTWRLASDHPDLYAAAIPIAGWGNPTTMAPPLKSLALWVFHGGADGTIGPGGDRAMVAAIRAAGNPNIQYTEFPGVGHNVWDMVYDSPGVIKWLLAQKR